MYNIDIDNYNNRIYPQKKDNYNICLLGVISAEHKGKNLASNIFKLYKNNPKYKFIILGEFNEIHDNLIVTGKYNNNNIFNLIKEYDIDCFLFVSIVEETYSFTLSIALKTGLPIIYNNIGSYTNRLKNYSNCFGYDENNIDKIHDIFIEIDNNAYTDNKKYDNSYKLYKNLPEFSEFLKNDNILNFNLDNIKDNLFHNNVCFIHFTNINNGLDIFLDQINNIKISGLYDKLDYIFVTLLGNHVYLPQDYKIKLIYYSSNSLELEYPSIIRIKYFSDIIPKNINILYINNNSILQKSNSFDYREYLEYFLIINNNICLNELKYYNCIGVNQQFYCNTDYNNKNHFYGNFWWSKTYYIKKLSILNENSNDVDLKHYLLNNDKKNDPRYYLSLHYTEKNLNEQHILPTEYNLEIIKKNIIININNKYIKKKNIYGVYFICCIGNYYRVVKKQIRKLIISGLYIKTDKILCFICKVQDDILLFLNKYNKIKIISTDDNLFEKFAINNYKNYLSGDYYLYYFHSKSVSRTEKNYHDWRRILDYFTLTKWRLSIELLEYYDCVGINLCNFPKIHFSGNYWWTTSEHLNKLKQIEDDYYLSPEMYLCSYPKTNKICIYKTNVIYGNTECPQKLYININDTDLINNISIFPKLNECEKNVC